MSQENNSPVTISVWVNVLAELNGFQKSTQRAFGEFIRKFFEDPTLPGLHVEPLKGVKNREIRSIRITRGCRVIVWRADQTNIYTILHADEGHNDAYDWVKRHRISQNMLDNTIRLDAIPDPTQLTQLLSGVSSAEPHVDPLSKFEDEDLTNFGVPEGGVFVLRAAPSVQVAKTMAYLLQPQTRACIECALEGYSKDEIEELIADERSQSASYGFSQKNSSEEFINAAGDNKAERDMRTMLVSNGTQQQFVVLTDDEDLERLMNAPLAQWRVFLHPSQRKVVNSDYSGPARVTGGAGTGKTVVAMHRARRLAQSLIRQGSDCKVLLTTYTANLADDIHDNMKLLCTDEELKHVEIINLDKWLHKFIRDNTKYTIQYQGAKINYLWQIARAEATDKSVKELPFLFFAEEWRQVVLANGITKLDEYLAIPRRGRGERLTRIQRESVWSVLERYRQLMDERKYCDPDYAMHVASELLNTTRRDCRFAFVVVDEGQDFSASAYRLLRSMVDAHPNDIFITSDNYQQLYGNRVSLKQCGIQIAGRSSRLLVNYRTTSEIKSAAESVALSTGKRTADTVLQTINDAREATQRKLIHDVSGDTKSDGLDYVLSGVFEDAAQDETFGDGLSLTHGEWPEAVLCKSWDAQFNQVVAWIEARLKQDPSARVEGMCVIVRDNQLVDDWVNALKAKTTYGALRLDNKTKDTTDTPGIRVATMYRAKGLEFDYVVVPDVDKCPPKSLIHKNFGNDGSLARLYRQERNLLYVAMTRPRKELLVTALG